MALPAIETVTNIYLYGQATTPQNFVDETLTIATPSVPIQVLLVDFMNGPGRFALGSEFEMVERFFEESCSDYQARRGRSRYI